MVGELHTVSGTALALAVIAMVVAGEERLVNVNGIRHRFAKTMAGDSHFALGGFADQEDLKYSFSGAVQKADCPDTFKTRKDERMGMMYAMVRQLNKDCEGRCGVEAGPISDKNARSLRK